MIVSIRMLIQGFKFQPVSLCITETKEYQPSVLQWINIKKDKTFVLLHQSTKITYILNDSNIVQIFRFSFQFSQLMNVRETYVHVHCTDCVFI